MVMLADHINGGYDGDDDDEEENNDDIDVNHDENDC